MNIPEGYIGLCSYCILNLNAAITARVGDDNRGLAKEKEGEIVQLSGGRTIHWKPGHEIPAGGSYLSEIILLFGKDADIRTYSGKLHPFAVTMNRGTLVCEEHNAEMTSLYPQSPRSYSDPRL